MKILLTGSGGFIGSNLLKFLLADKNNFVFAVSREPLNYKAENLSNIILDLANPDFTNGFEFKTDVVIHLAQSAKHREFPEGAEDMFKVNVQSTFQLLEWCRKSACRKFIFASTGNVYKSSNKKITEDHTAEPKGFYAASKFAAENLIHQYSEFFSTVILRLFSPYGPGQKNMLIPNMINRVRNKQEITLAKNKGLILSPVYIDDCCKIIERVARKEIANGVYNVSGVSEITLAEIVQIIEGEIKMDANIRVTDEQPLYLAANSEKLFHAINFTPSVSIAEGLKKTILL